MSPVERPAPPAGEEVHLPGGSLQPLLLCVGVTTALLGVTASVWLVVLGSLLAVVTLVLWIRDVRSDVQHLPAQHESHSV